MSRNPDPKPAPLEDPEGARHAHPAWRQRQADVPTEQIDVKALLERLEATEVAAKAAAQQAATLRAEQKDRDKRASPAKARPPAPTRGAHRSPAEAWSLASTLIVGLLVLGACTVVLAYLFLAYVPR